MQLTLTKNPCSWYQHVSQNFQQNAYRQRGNNCPYLHPNYLLSGFPNINYGEWSKSWTEWEHSLHPKSLFTEYSQKLKNGGIQKLLKWYFFSRTHVEYWYLENFISFFLFSPCTFSSSHFKVGNCRGYKGIQIFWLWKAVVSVRLVLIFVHFL